MAGNGNGNYYAGQGPGGGPGPAHPRTADRGNCWQSHSSYPWRFTDKINRNDQQVHKSAFIWHAACGGSKVEDLRDQWGTVHSDWQDAADIVLLSFGGNDVGFSDIAKNCIAGIARDSTCNQNLDTAEQALAGVMNALETEISWLKTQTNAHIVLVGYPDLTNPLTGCINDHGTDRIRALHAEHERQANELAARQGSRVRYVSVTDTFVGHGPCRWPTTYVHGAVDPLGPADGPKNESFHPTAQGAFVYGEVLWAYGIQNLHSPTPSPNCTTDGDFWMSCAGTDNGDTDNGGVAPPAPAPEVWSAQYVSQSAWLDPGQTQAWDITNAVTNQSGFLRFRFRNDGNTTWSRTGSNPVRLGTSAPRDSSSVLHAGNRGATMVEASVPPGGVGTFVVPVRTPATPGTYREHWEPVAEHRTWMPAQVWREFVVRHPTATGGRNLLTNPGFEQGVAGWSKVFQQSATNWALYASLPGGYGPHSGSRFLEANSTAGGSIANDVSITPQAGDKFTFSIWLRHRHGPGVTTTGTIALWALGGNQANASRAVSLTHEWQEFSVTLDVASAGHSGLRAEVYLTSPSRQFNLDDAVVYLGEPAVPATPPSEPEPATVFDRLKESEFRDSSGRDGSVVRLYAAVFLRLPDRDGFDFWSGSSGRSLQSMADFFVSSPEFQDRYGTVSDAEFVELMYRNILARSPDADGREFWTNRLRSGTSRAQILIGFSESVEFRAKTATR